MSSTATISKVCLDDSTWQAPRKVFFEKLNLAQSTFEEADIIWSDCQWSNNTPDPTFAARVQPGQQINFFPEASTIFRKDELAQNLNHFSKLHPQSFTNVMPKS